jgi:hypothetical protein
VSITLGKHLANHIPAGICIPSILTKTLVDMTDIHCCILKGAANATLLLRLRANSPEERPMEHVVNSDKDMSLPISHARGFARDCFSFSNFYTKLRKLTHGKRYIALRNSF